MPKALSSSTTTATQKAKGTAAILAHKELQDAAIDTTLNGITYVHTSHYPGEHS